MSDNVHLAELQAVQEWMAQTVVPLLYDDPSGQFLIEMLQRRKT